VTGGWRKLHKEELRDLYSSPSIIRITKSSRMRWAGHVARMGEKRNVYRLLVRKSEGKRPLGRPRRRWMASYATSGRVVGSRPHEINAVYSIYLILPASLLSL
jgi:hypothetical protein